MSSRCRLLATLTCAAIGASAESVPTIDASCVGCPLRSLADYEVESKDGVLEITLVVGVARLVTPNTTFLTRVYNGSFGGPRLSLQTGDYVNLTLINTLLDVDNTGTFNTPRTLNSTNLHVHGLHVSGMPPGDSILVDVPPGGGSYKYQYFIPEDHLPGHHWYHPHHHGATAVQNSGGMYGSIEINDPEFTQPGEIEALPIEYLEILNMPFKGGFDLESTQAQYNKDLLHTKPPFNDREHLLVNGGSYPTITIEKNQWYRFRIGYFSTYHNLWSVIKDAQAWMPGSSGACEWRLMAHDGNYLDQRPRKFGLLPLTQASREEIVLRCTEVGSFSWESIKFGATDIYGLTEDDWAAVWGKGVDKPQAFDSFEAKIATFEVVDSDIVAEDLKTYTSNRPCYVASTLQEDETTMHKRDLKFSIAPEDPNNPDGVLVFGINKREFALEGPDVYAFSVPVGGVVEYTYQGADYHSAHVHINPVQLVTATDDAGVTPLKTYEENPFAGFSQVGDWFDTLLLGAPVLKTRQLIDRYTGDMVVHCHILIHEDLGMMSTINITGVEGTRCFSSGWVWGCGDCYTGATGKRGWCYVDPGPILTGSPTTTAAPTASDSTFEPTALPVEPSASPTAPPRSKKDAALPLSPRYRLVVIAWALAAALA